MVIVVHQSRGIAEKAFYIEIFSYHTTGKALFLRAVLLNQIYVLLKECKINEEDECTGQSACRSDPETFDDNEEIGICTLKLCVEGKDVTRRVHVVVYR